jgi:hypothetical protein
MGRALLLAMPFTGCRSEQGLPPPLAANAPRAPVALIGDWVRVAPATLRGDTLSLRADSSARGVIPWGTATTFVRISRWQLRFASRDPVAAREDWRQGHKDGGDADCATGRTAAGCTSLPLLCLGAANEYQCEAFEFSPPDSLAFSSGLRYIRATGAAHP